MRSSTGALPCTSGAERRAAGPVVDVSPPKPEREEHKFSSTQVNLPTDLSQSIVEMARAIPDDEIAADGRAGDSQGTAPHVTVKYGIESDEVDDIRKALADQGPVTITLGKTSLFTNDEADVLKVDIDSDDLRQVRAKIEQAVKAGGDTHPEYLAHATVAYLLPGKGKQYAGDARFDGQTVTLDRLTFSTSDGRIFEVPLTGTPVVASRRGDNVPGEVPPARPAREGSTYEGEDLAEMEPAVIEGQAERLYTIGRLREALADPKNANTPRAKRWTDELKKIEADYEGIYVEWENAGGDRQALRRSVEAPAPVQTGASPAPAAEKPGSKIAHADEAGEISSTR